MLSIIDRILKSIDPEIALDWSTNAEEAIQKIKKFIKKGLKKPYQLIITDVLLDGSKTGIDFWKFCFQNYKNIPIVLTSSTHKDILFPNGVPDHIVFLQKPFSITDCKKLLKNILTSNNEYSAQIN